MHYKIGVICVYNGHGFYTLVVITWQSNPHISQFNSTCNEFMSVWTMFVYNTLTINQTHMVSGFNKFIISSATHSTVKQKSSILVSQHEEKQF